MLTRFMHEGSIYSSYAHKWSQHQRGYLLIPMPIFGHGTEETTALVEVMPIHGHGNKLVTLCIPGL